MPKPVILVGKNGSGKSTFISFIINAIMSLRQTVYDDTEVETGKVYRIRSPLGIHGAETFYFAKVSFEKSVVQTEWQLVDRKNRLVNVANMHLIDASWHNVSSEEGNYYSLTHAALPNKQAVEDEIEGQVLLFFPADRFESPDWQNVENLSTELKIPEPPRITGRTQRRLFARNRLKPILDWVSSIILDLLLVEHMHGTVTALDGQNVTGRFPAPGAAHAIFEAILLILRKVLGLTDTEQLMLNFSDRKSRIIAAQISADGKTRTIKDLLSLSAGEAALFSMFASIIRDADLTRAPFSKLDDIKGIVIIDEADLHLHVGLQHDAFPELVKLFPNVQFVISVHSPMCSLGFEKHFGEGGFEIIELPEGNLTSAETFSEFEHAYNAYTSTKKFSREAATQLASSNLPIVVVEGKTDELILAEAWKRLYPATPMPFQLISPSDELGDKQGGAKSVNSFIRTVHILNKKVLGVFDNDSTGCGQFKGLKKFDLSEDGLSSKHPSKDIFALTLPAPAGREKYTENANSNFHYLTIEHYFSDETLAAAGFDVTPIWAELPIFQIDEKSALKMAFANNLASLDDAAFLNFKTLFDKINEVANLW